MRVNAIINTGNDADIIEQNIDHHVQRLDSILVLDNASVDGTKDILKALAAKYPSKLRVIDVEYQICRQMHIVNAYKEHQRYQCDFLFVLDADEFLHCDSFDELLTIPTNKVGYARWKTYIPSALDHKHFISEMIYRRATEPDGCHKVVLPTQTTGDFVLGNHYLHQGQLRADAITLDSIFLAHYPVRTIEQIARKIGAMTTAFVGADMSQSWHTRNAEIPKTLQELQRFAMQYCDPYKATQHLVMDPLA